MGCDALRDDQWERLKGFVRPDQQKETTTWLRSALSPAVERALSTLAGGQRTMPSRSETLEAINDPQHERHDECKEWMPENFDPVIVNVEAIADALAALAKRWSRKPARQSKSN
jgi:hypothetical protein